MNPEAVIEAYVNDVARRLAGAKRNDVAAELNALLREELQGRAGEAGRAADEKMALDLVRAFGPPEEVAERYLPPGFAIIPPARSGQFALFAFGGVALQWLVTMPPMLSRILEPGREFAALGQWWLTYGLGALWWPGFMVTAATIAGWMRFKWPPAQTSTWRPRVEDSDRINRTAFVFAGGAAVLGIGALVFSLWAFANLMPEPAASALAINPDFLPLGGALAVLLWLANAVVFSMVFVEGRWRPLTRRSELVIYALWVAVLIWFVAGARIFLATPADQGAKGALALVLLFLLIDITIKLYRAYRRPRTPAAISALAEH